MSESSRNVRIVRIYPLTVLFTFTMVIIINSILGLTKYKAMGKKVVTPRSNSYFRSLAFECFNIALVILMLTGVQKTIIIMMMMIMELYELKL